MNEKIYIHEFIDIIGHNRANYMHHMTANFSPVAQVDRHQLCYGVWGVVGTTKRWPEVVNLWEEDGFDGMASSFRHEFNHTTLQDPKLAKWWAAAAHFRSGGTDRPARTSALDPHHRRALRCRGAGRDLRPRADHRCTGTGPRAARSRPNSGRRGLRVLRVAAGRCLGDGHDRRLGVLASLGHPDLGALGGAGEGPAR